MAAARSPAPDAMLGRLAALAVAVLTSPTVQLDE